MKKYISYFRVSTAAQGESGLGLDAQKAVIEHFAHDGEIIASYTDIASGKNTIKRPQLHKAIQHCKSAGASLIVAKADRLSRNVQDALAILDDLGEGNIVFCDCPNSDRFTVTIIFAVAERERILISIRTKAALAEARKRGTKLGRPKGIPHTEAAKKRMSDAPRAKKDISKMELNLAQKMRKEGCSYTAIARNLNELGATAPKGGDLTATHIYRMLKANEVKIENFN